MKFDLIHGEAMHYYNLRGEITSVVTRGGENPLRFYQNYPKLSENHFLPKFCNGPMPIQDFKINKRQIPSPFLQRGINGYCHQSSVII